MFDCGGTTEAFVFPVPDEPYKTPEERLMVAVLQEALGTFYRGLSATSPLARRHFLEVDQWIRSRDNEGVFSFDNICCTLRIDPEYLRAGLAATKRKARLSRAPVRVRSVRRSHIDDRRIWRGRIG